MNIGSWIRSNCKFAAIGPVFHGTRSDFKRFDIARGDIGIHFGTLDAAMDRLGKKGGGRIDYSIEQDGSEWWAFDEDGNGHGPFPSKPDAETFVATQPQQYSPIKAMLNLDNVIETPDLGQWGFNGIGTWLLHQGHISQAEYEAAWKEWDQEGTLRKILLNKGIDGFKYVNEVEDRGSVSYIVLNPSDIRVLQGTLA